MPPDGIWRINMLTKIRSSQFTGALLCLVGLIICSLAYSAQTDSQQADGTQAPFNHAKTGFVLQDVHATLKCEQCHINGIFKNTPKLCSECHAIGTRVSAKPKPINHVPTTSECNTCHISAANFLVKSFKHIGITGGCNTCHNGQSLGVISKPASHFPTLLPCETCHNNTTSFTLWQMNHNGITSGCASCHGGPAGEPVPIGVFPGVVSYNSSTHFPLTAFGASPPDCNACHIGFVSFLGAQFSHSLGSTCTSCHQGQYQGVVSINPSVHIPLPSGSTCVNCHADPATVAVPSFLGVVFHTTSLGNTAAAAGTCLTCHNGAYVSQNALSKSVSHIPTNAGCNTCHTDPTGTPANTTANFTTFLNVKFHQTTLGNPPSVACTTCHNGSYVAVGAQAKIVGHVTTNADCGTCHTNTANYTTFLGAVFSHTGTYGSFPADGSIASPLCGSCHNGTTATGKVSGHIVTTADCNSSGCHSMATTGCPNCVNFSNVAFNHINSTTGYTSFTSTGPVPYNKRCDSCHNGSTLLAQPISAGHVPTAGADCVTCHIPASTGCLNSGNCMTFLGATFSHTGTTAPTGSCGTCHQGQYAGVVSINPAIHIPQSSGNACDKCHTATLSSLSTTPTFNNVVFHQNALGNPPSGTCATCHSGAYTSQNALAQNTGHVATTSDCVVCHTATNTSSYTTFLGAGFTHSPGTYATFPTATPATPTCKSCHNGATATGTNAGHPVLTASQDCMACHTSSILVGCPNCSSFGIPAAPVHNSSTYTAASGGCVSCHNGVTATGLSADPGHIPIGSVGCDQCHPVYDGATSINFGTTSTTAIGGTSSKYAMKHSALAGSPRCDSCHNGSFVGQGIYGAVTKVSNHIPTTIISTAANTDCTTCHNSFTLANVTVVSGTADWVKEVMNHNSAQGGAPNYCVTCHLSSATYLSSKIQKKNHNGASTSKDCSSSSCHKPLGKTGSAYSSWS
jgi:hypothetical protein